MSFFLSTSIPISFTGRHRRKIGAPSGHISKQSRQKRIHILDDDSLLHVFYFCRPILLDEEEDNDRRILQGGDWDRERWWYKLVKVCRRWRSLIFGSASYLGLSLLCTYGTPIDMLAHSTPLPLTINYVDEHRDITAQDKSVILLALQHRDRVRRIRFLMHASNLRKLLLDLNKEFPKLEHLYIRPLNTKDRCLALPKSFRAPNLCHLVLVNFALPLGSPLFSRATAASLVTLSLQGIPSSMYFRPDELLRWLSLMPQIETLGIGFHSGVRNREVWSPLSRMPMTTHVTLSKLRWFGFEGASPYLEALLHWTTIPLLEKLEIHFFDRPMSSAPYLAQFINANKNLRSRRVNLRFHHEEVVVCAYRHDRARMYAWCVRISRRHSNWWVWQVAPRTAQLLHPLRPALSSVVNLILECYGGYSVSSERFTLADRTHWREILGSFGNVKILHVPNGLIRGVSRSLQPENGESLVSVLPQLKKLLYSGSRDAADEWMPTITARQKAGHHPITLTRKL